MSAFLFVGGLIVASLVLLYGFHRIYSWLTPYDDTAQIRANIEAVKIVHVCAYLGVLIAAAGSLFGSPEATQYADLRMFCIDGVAAVAMSVLLYRVGDLVVLRKVDNAYEIARGNRAVAIVEASLYIGQGVIMFAAFAGGGQGFWMGMLSAIVFSVAGQMILALSYHLYVLGHRLLERVPAHPQTPNGARVGRDIETEIERGDIDTAIAVASTIIAFSLVLGASIYGDSAGWWTDVASFLMSAVVGLLLLTAVREFVDWIARQLKLAHTRAAVLVASAITVLTAIGVSAWILS